MSGARLALVAILVTTACGDDATDPDAGVSSTDAGPRGDGGRPDDAAQDGGAAGGEDAGAVDATAPDAGLSDAGPPGALTLLSVPGCAFEVTTAGETREHAFGEVGAEYAWIEVAMDVEVADWRRDLFDREVLNHIAFGLSRVAPISRERYILGYAAQIHPAEAGLRRTTVFFGRVDLDERPPGEGYMGYTSFREAFPWRVGRTYHVRARLDAEGASQLLEIALDGEVVQTLTGAIAYFDPSLTSSGWTLELGGPETDHRDVSPVGYRYCDVRVTAAPR